MSYTETAAWGSWTWDAQRTFAIDLFRLGEDAGSSPVGFERLKPPLGFKQRGIQRFFALA